MTRAETDAAWRAAKREQARQFKALPLADKWRAMAEAGELLLLIERARRRRRLQ
jgi:hypothetical protein